jgi:hypothetical protein
MFNYILLTILALSFSSFFWLPGYFKSIIKKANQDALARVKVLWSEGVSNNSEIRKKLLAENYTAEEIGVAIMAASFEKQNPYLAPSGSLLAGLFLYKSYIMVYIGQVGFYIFFGILFLVFVYFLKKQKSN